MGCREKKLWTGLGARGCREEEVRKRTGCFMCKSMVEDGGVVVAGEKREVRRYVEVLQYRRCCEYGDGYAECTGRQYYKRCEGGHEI